MVIYCIHNIRYPLELISSIFIFILILNMYFKPRITFEI